MAKSTTDERLAGLLDELRPGHHGVIAGPNERVDAAFEDLIGAAHTRKLDVAVVANAGAATALVEGVDQVFSPSSGADLGLFAVALATADVIVIADAQELSGAWVDVVTAAASKRSTPVRFVVGVATRNDCPDWVDTLQTHDGDVLIEVPV